MQTEKFRRQHSELLRLAGEIAGMLSVEQLSKDATEAARGLNKLAGLLLVHLTLEDASLYPRLLQHADPAVRTMASDYMTSMGGLKATFEGYAKKWTTAAAIQAGAAAFVTETNGIIDALGKRIDKENNELYALVDRLQIKLNVA